MKHLFFLSLTLILPSCGGPSNLESAEEAGEEVSQETEERNVQSEWVNFGEGDLPPRTSPPSKLDSEPFEVHSTG